MRTLMLLLGLFFCHGLMGQNSTRNNRILEWADYYFMNKDFDKAFSLYSKMGESLPLRSRRNFSRVYAQRGQLQEAARTLKPLVDSDSAFVKDYYYFASYLTNNEKLRDEYRRKAIRLPIEEYSHKPIDPINPSYKLVPLSLNTEGSEFGAHVINFNDKNLLIYTKNQSKEFTKGLSKKILSRSPIYNLYKAEWDSKNLQAQSPKAFELGINSVFQDGPSSWDGLNQILYLTRSSKSYQKQKTIQLDLYSFTYKNNKKPIAQTLPFNLKGYSTIHPAVNLQNQRLYFASDRPGGFGGMDLYYVDILGDEKYGLPVNLGPDINSTRDEVFPFAYGKNYLFYSSKADDGSLFLKLAVNTIDVRWYVMNLPAPFRSNLDDFSFSLNDQLEYGMMSSNRSIDNLEDDIYVFKFTPKLSGVEDQYIYNPIDTLIISQNGVLKNDNLQMLRYDPLTSLFSKEAELVNDVHHGTLKLNNNGSFLYKNEDPSKVKDSFSYIIKSKYGKSSSTKVVLMRSEVSIEKLTSSMEKTFLPIFYDFNKSNLLKDYKDRVDTLVAAMKENPDMIVEVSSYTDCRGSKDYNLKLSQKRNQTIIDYVSKQIGNSERIFGKGYGENTMSGNNTLDYLIVGGSFKDLNNALYHRKKYQELGYDIIINKTEKDQYHLIVGQANTFYIAQKLAKKIRKKGFQVWINKCNCCKLSEEERSKHRRTDFKIIKP